MYSSKIVKENDGISMILEFVKKNGLLQQSLQVKEIYKKQKGFDYQYIACFDVDKQIVGVFPFVHYNGTYGDIIHSLPYIGYGGGCWISRDQQILNSMIDKVIEYAKENEVLLLTVCTPPQFNGEDKYRDILQPEFIQENFYQFIDMKDDFLKRMTSKNRNNLKRNLRMAEENGVYLKEDYSQSFLFTWYEKIYVPRLTETGGAIYPFEVFDQLRRAFAKDRLVIQYAMIDDEIIGAGLFFKQKKSLDNFMRVVSTPYMRTNAGVVLDYWSINYAKEHGFPFYNWQSCDRIDSPIFNYKKTWGSNLDHHYYLTKIINPIEALQKVPLEEIKKAYKGIYVMPFSEFE